MPIGKIGGYAGKGGDYSSGNVNVDHSTTQSKFHKNFSYRMVFQALKIVILVAAYPG